ncbi:MAG: SUMF1/EgtB/PvdO family nonheme iron enzyme [Anaerohalosphaeraceae bacterium]
MSTQIKSIMIILVLSVCSFTHAATYGGGSGTAEDPYQIWTPQQMNAIGANSADWSKHFKLMADIDMSAYPGTQYNIIGNLTTEFIGTFDGNGHVVRNLTYTSDAVVNYVGLFGYTNNATIQRLGLENVSLSSGGGWIGGLVGYNSFSIITACYVTGSVSGTTNQIGGLVGENRYSSITSCYGNAMVNGNLLVGGLVGSIYDCTLTSCYATGSCNGIESVGGLVGRISGTDSTLTACYAAGSVNGTHAVGGLVGDLYWGTLITCYAVGPVTGTGNYAGGIVGYNESGTVMNCYATSAVSGNSYVGGLVGSNFRTITGCYSTGAVRGTGSYIGGLVGNDYGTTTSCFWDTWTSGQTDGVGNQNPDPSGVKGKDTWGMKSLSTFTDAGWDFSALDGDPADWWKPGAHYPHLSWEVLYGGGSGKSVDPYQIWTPEQMNAIGTNPVDWGSCFKLMADIDMSAYTGTQYNIIGNSTTKFAGTFDGNGHIIRNLTYKIDNAMDYVGLFGWIADALIQNLGVENISISSGGKNIGGLVGYNEESLLSNCYMTGSVSGLGHVGGLVGRNNSNSRLLACYVNGAVHGTNAVGGLVGGNYSGSLENCYATGSVSGTGNYVGGLIGYNTKGKLTACYAAGSVAETGTRIGGLAGWNSADSIVTACFWDTLISGTSNGAGGGSSSGITGKTMADMQLHSTFTSAGWDFTNETANGNSNFWRMCENGVDYPRLNWESMKGDFACPDGVRSEDLDYYVGQWLRMDCMWDNNYCGSADMNNSHTVDLDDWVIFAAQWLKEGDGVPIDMVYLPGGTFQMGNSISGEGYSNELPVHAVTLSPFYMGKYEITNDQYCDFLNSVLSQGLISVGSDNIIYKAGSGTSYPYCDTYQSFNYSQINWNGTAFTVRSKSGRGMANDPMVQVSWYGAVAYCNWRSQQEGKQTCYNLTTWERDPSKKGYHLPTEAQWEYAARGGLSGKRFPWGDTINQTQANFYSYTYSYDVSPDKNQHHPIWNDGVYPYTSPVGFFDGGLKYKANYNWPSSVTSYQTANGGNGYGFYDMAGNVLEWCNDWYGNSYYSSSPSSNSTGPTIGTSRVLRGGSWGHDAFGCRVAGRGGENPGDRYGSIGFRVSLDHE